MIILAIHLLISLGTLLVRENIEGTVWFFFKFGMQMLLGGSLINLFFVLSYLIKYVHKSIISDFSIFGIHRVIFLS